jgi:hypothetical protein
LTNEQFIFANFKGHDWTDLGVDGIAPYRVWRIAGSRKRRVMGWSDWKFSGPTPERIPQVVFMVTKETMDPIQKFLKLRDAKEFAYLLATGQEDT